MALFFRKQHDAAYEAFDRGDLHEAARRFAELALAKPKNASYHYMLGLAHKYLRQWEPSLRANLRSLEVRDDIDQASAWNGAIAATALGDWARARELWAKCGVPLPPGEGPIDEDFGTVAVRLNPWGDGETLFAQRIDPARARLRNVPLPSSGFRGDDVVLHDGACRGERRYGDGVVPVFDVLQRLEQSAYETYGVFATCATPADAEAMLALRHADVGVIEDWTASVSHLCLRCSYGTPHEHAAPREARAWESERIFGFAARDAVAVDALVAAWLAGGADRRVESIEVGVAPLSAPADGSLWWDDPEDDAS